MTILPIPLENSSSAVEFFKQGGQVDIPRPQECFYEKCRLKEPLRKNGRYARQVIYWGLCFLVEILRFRCRRCGKTASCPYGWLVPYRRFSAEVIAGAIETYASRETTYRDVSLDLSDLELAESAMDVRAEELCQTIVKEIPVTRADDAVEPRCRPAHTTVFNWVEFGCRRIEALLVQLQKELVQERKRGKKAAPLLAESLVENPNSYKTVSAEKNSMLNRQSFAACAATQLLGQSTPQWYRLRAYFLTKAESRKDLLTDTRLQLPITQTFELVIF